MFDKFFLLQQGFEIVKTVVSTNCIDEAAGIIRNGGIVAFPTETVYGLGANAFDKQAVAGIFEAKGRPADNPLIVHLSTVADIANVAQCIPDAAFKLFEAYSPGPLTVVLNKKPCIPDTVTAGLNTVGIRIPSHPIAREFISACALPIAAPSANRSKRVSPTTASAVLEDMDGRIPLIIDGGSCSVGIESTVLSLTGEVPTVLRPGAITPAMIARVLGKCVEYKGKVTGSAPAPGMKYQHYRPLVDFILCDSGEEITNRYALYSSLGQSPIIMGKTSHLPNYAGC